MSDDKKRPVELEQPKPEQMAQQADQDREGAAIQRDQRWTAATFPELNGWAARAKARGQFSVLERGFE
jgi:hypothetical protein